jgi:hypothetical protein
LTEKKRRPMYRKVSTCFLFLGTYFIASWAMSVPSISTFKIFGCECGLCI